MFANRVSKCFATSEIGEKITILSSEKKQLLYIFLGFRENRWIFCDKQMFCSACVAVRLWTFLWRGASSLNENFQLSYVSFL